MDTPDYGRLRALAFELSMSISAEMAKLDSMTDPRWPELHDVSKIASAAFCTLGRLQATDEPVPYTLTGAAGTVTWTARVTP